MFSVYSIFINIILFIGIIILLHYLWDYLRDSFTKKKTKDLVNTQIEKYKKIIEEIQGSPSSQINWQKEREKEKEELLEFVNHITPPIPIMNESDPQE
jgi:hypothetical protein